VNERPQPGHASDRTFVGLVRLAAPRDAGLLPSTASGGGETLHPMTILVTAYRRTAPAHAFCVPVVRELPAPRPAAGVVAAW
jgi:hypothetical protein